MNKSIINWNWKLLTILIYSIFYILMFSSNVEATWWNSSFDYRKQINITNPGSTDLTDFPIYLNISYENGMQNDFDDLRFVSNTCENNNTNLLTYEVEYTDSNHAVIWVKIPSLSSLGENICMYYGNSIVSSIQNPTETWKSNYDIVYHMDSTGQDSTSNNRDRVSDIGSPTDDNNFLGYGQTFDGNDAWSMANIAYWEAAVFDRSHEIVFTTGTDITNRQTLFAEGGGTNGISMYIRNGQLYARWWSESDGWSGDHINTTISTSTTYHAVMQWANPIGSTYSYNLYVNGIHIGYNGTRSHDINAHSGDGGIAYSGPTSKDYHDITGSAGNYFDGTIHELRAYTNAESKEWINLSAQNIINHNNIVKYNSKQLNPDIFNIVINEPSIASIYPIKNNNTFILNTTINCNSNIFNCGNVTINAQYNDSLNTYDNISTSTFSPIWTSNSNPQNCILTAGNSCDLIWSLNISGAIGDKVKIRNIAQSNETSLANILTEILTVEVVASAAILFNQTTLEIPSFVKTYGPSYMNATVLSTIGNNTDITITCSNGDCSEITESWIDTTDLNIDTSQEIEFTCSSNSIGDYWAIFDVISNEDNIENTINVSCSVTPLYGPIQILINTPINGTQVNHDKLFTLNTTMNCTGTCGNISAYAVSDNAFGDGSDGNLTITSLNTIVNNYTYLIGNENNGDSIITVNSASEFSVGDEILIIQMQNGTGAGSAGTYEFNNIASISSNDITLVNSLSNTYGSGTFDTTSASVTQIIRIPQYTILNITSSGSITAPAWNGYTGGIVIIKANKEIITQGYVNVSQKGFRGGDCNGCGDSAWGDQGEGYLGTGTGSLSANGNGGGGGYGPSGFNGEPGAGGSYGTSGSNGISSFTSIGAPSIGNADLSNIFLGGGAGGGGDDDLQGSIRAQYVDGSGSILIFSKKITDARIEANGENGVGNGASAGTTGGGAGGAIWLSAEEISISNVEAIGGLGFVDSDDVGGDGGDGRIRLDYISLSGSTTNPSAGHIGAINDLYSIIPTSSSSPLWTPYPQPQWCSPEEDGSCNFIWLINATGEINSNHSIKVAIFSNLTQIKSNSSNITTIQIINDIPSITLINPLNNYKTIGADTTQFSWNISDIDDRTLSCKIFIDGINKANTTCYNDSTNSINLNISIGNHNWSVYVNDSRLGNSTSNVFNFTVLEKQYRFIEKSINSVGSGIYRIDLTLKNYLNISQNTLLHDFIENGFNAGSFTPLYDFANVSFGPTFGNTYSWNLTMTPISTTNLNYSIASTPSDIELLKQYIIGLE